MFSGDLLGQTPRLNFRAMASMQHEGLLLLFRNRPALAPELLRDALGLTLPDWSEARVESAELTEVVPTEYRADLVVLLLEGKPIFAIVVEVQLSRDEDKRKTWPLYLTSLRSRVGCPTALLVVAPDAAVARWCAQPIELGHPGFVLQPLVAGPDAVPIIVDKQAAGRDPELAVLSAMAHGHQAVGPTIVQAVMSTAGGLDEERFRLYVDLALSSLGEAARRALEALMMNGNYEPQFELFRQWLAQGRHEGEQIALFEVLDARGLEVDATTRQHILACKDLEQLKVWVRKAVTAKSAQELFASESAPKPAADKAGKASRSTKTPKSRSKR
jgi:hypothetical protein